MKRVLNKINYNYFFLKLVELFSAIYNRTLRKNINQKLLIFGGDHFSDNSKYLFLYLNSFSSYRIIWLSKFKDVVYTLRKGGFEAYKRFSLKAFFLLLKAKYIFITHTLTDILPVNLNPYTKLIYLAHGIPFKTTNFDVKNFQSLFPTKFQLEIIFKMFKTTEYHISCSDNFHAILSNAYRISKKRVISTGYPRNDILFINDRQYISKIYEKNKIPRSIERIILYAPTFREEKVAKFPLDRQLLNKLNKVLKESKSILLLKAHKFEQIIDFKTLENIKIVDKNQDIMNLLLISDILITDYSSVFLDYILTLRPIIFFAYDLESFRKLRGFYYGYESFIPGPLVKDGIELIEKIKTISIWAPKYKDQLIKVKNFSHKYQDGNSCYRICKYLHLKLDPEKIKYQKKWYNFDI
ncbi:MAG: CDP-glycerol glycerophosphotransferase family protein [Promethearchaeota archaeon]